jgi:hypothetical protein
MNNTESPKITQYRARMDCLAITLAYLQAVAWSQGGKTALQVKLMRRLEREIARYAKRIKFLTDMSYAYPYRHK